MSEDAGPPPAVRAAGALLIIGAILAAFLYRVASGGTVQPWLVLLVSVLGLAAGAAVLGTDAIRAGYAVLKGFGR